MSEHDRIPRGLKIQAAFKLTEGRLNRTDHFLLSVFCGLILIFVGFLSLGASLLIIVMLPIAYLFLPLTCGRFRDVGLSGWWVLPWFAVSIIISTLIEKEFINDMTALVLDGLDVVLVILFFLWPGAKGENKYGEYIEIYNNPLREIIGSKIRFFS